MIVYDFDTIDELSKGIERLDAEFKLFNEILTSWEFNILEDFIVDAISYLKYDVYFDPARGKFQPFLEKFAGAFILDPQKFQYLRSVCFGIRKHNKTVEKLFAKFYERSKSEYMGQFIMNDKGPIDIIPDEVISFDEDGNLILNIEKPDNKTTIKVIVAHEYFKYISGPEEYFTHLLNIRVNNFIEWMNQADKIMTIVKSINLTLPDNIKYDYLFYFMYLIKSDEHILYVPARINVTIQ